MGLVVTNEHVVGKSEYLAVQFDAKRKVAATLLAADSQKDVAILWVNLTPYPEVVIAPLFKSGEGKSPAVEGERVFTIGSPLSQTRVLTTGVVSQIEPKAIISDINTNPGNSGGPLFNTGGFVIGVTTYNAQAKRGPGLSGIVRIEEVAPLIDRARAKTVGAAPPSLALLPVDPQDPFPLDALRAITVTGKVDRGPYGFQVGDFGVGVGTPPQAYRVRLEQQQELEKERERRNKKRGEGTEENTSDIDLKEYDSSSQKAEVAIVVRPKVKVKVWASMADPYNRVKAAYKTDFYRMRLLCGTKEVAPILPGRVQLGGVQNARVSLEDTTYEGLYLYPPNAIDPSCGQMTLEIYSDKNSPPTVKQLDQATIRAVWSDFEPYRTAQSARTKD